jgi:hypothetical protein
MIHPANPGLRFVLELCALAALGGWAYRTGGTTLAFTRAVADPAFRAGAPVPYPALYQPSPADQTAGS